MPQQPSYTLQNSFIGGLKTEFTGLNFPENAWTSGDNVIPTIVGDTIRREGINLEVNGVGNSISSSNLAMSTYKWNNVGGDGLTQIVVNQVGNILYFYRSSTATIASPLSNQLLVSTINISTYIAVGSSNDPSKTECQFTDGNGYLFVFHPYCDP